MRPKLSFRPSFTPEIRGVTVNTVRKYYRTLHRTHEFEDLLQEAFLVYWRCKNRYTGTVDNPAWFMSLYTQALHNRLRDMLRRQKKAKPFTSLTSAAWEAIVGPLDNDGAAMCMLEELAHVHAS